VIRVLHVIESLDPGGAERVVLEHAAHRDSTRFAMEVCCVVRRGPLADAVEANGVPVHLLSRARKIDPGAVMRLASLVSRGRFDVVHNHNFTALSVGVPAAVLAGARAVVRTEHNVLAGVDSHRRFLSRAAALRENAQIAVAEAVRESHVRMRRVPADRFVTIPNGIGDARFGEEERTGETRGDVLRELGVPESDLVCLSVGSLTSQKDHANLIRAAALVPPDIAVTFLVAGDGPLRGDLERSVRDAGLERRVRLLGQRLDVPRLLRAADLFVLSSDWEGLPITLLEAMAARVACLATRVGGTSEVIRDGVDGFLVPPRDPGALAGAIARLARGPGSRTRAAAEGRRTYETRFTGAQMARQTEALYELALSGRADLATARRIKVLYVIGQLGYGGAERQLVELASRLPRDRFEPMVCVLSDRGPLARELDAAGVPVVCFNKRRGILSAATGGLVRLVKRERPAIIHSYLFSGNWRSLVAGRLLRVPLVVSSVRNVDIHSRLWLNVLERMFAYLVDRVIANAEAVKDYVVGAHWIPPQRIHVIHNGVAMERFGPHAPPGRTVAMLASLTPKKAPFTFLDAAALVRQRVPDARFLVIGDGPLRGALEARARSLGLGDAVRFVGETDDAPGALAGADVSVLTSIKEGCSNVVLESMAAGCPMVATAVGGNPELIEDGVTGYLVPAGDANAVADRIVRLLSEPGLAARMGEAARAHVVTEFSAERMVEKTVGVYTALLSERVPGLVEWATATAAREGARP
jgi:glycosyltransferase involved in cell wall biosynthesis